MSDDESTEEEILGAAAGVLVDRGYADFTTQAVADEAGVSQSLVHYYFDSKQELILSVFEIGIDWLDEMVEESMASDNPAARLRALTDVMVDDDEDAMAFQRMMIELAAQAPHDDELREILQYDQEQLRDYVARTVEAGIERGQFRDTVDPEAFAAMYVAGIYGAQNWMAIFGPDSEQPERVTTELRALVDGYLAEGEP